MTPSRAAAVSTEPVWMPTSLAVRDHAYQRCTMASCAAESRRSAPVAATSAIAIAIDVSSVHSPRSHAPPPTIATSSSGPRGGLNSYGAPSASPAAVASSTPSTRSLYEVIPSLSSLEHLLRKSALISSTVRYGSDMSDETYRDTSGRSLSDYPRPSVAVDTAVLTLDPELGLVVLEVRRADRHRLGPPGHVPARGRDARRRRRPVAAGQGQRARTASAPATRLRRPGPR